MFLLTFQYSLSRQQFVNLNSIIKNLHTPRQYILTEKKRKALFDKPSIRPINILGQPHILNPSRGTLRKPQKMTTQIPHPPLSLSLSPLHGQWTKHEMRALRVLYTPRSSVQNSITHHRSVQLIRAAVDFFPRAPGTHRAFRLLHDLYTNWPRRSAQGIYIYI